MSVAAIFALAASRIQTNNKRHKSSQVNWKNDETVLVASTFVELTSISLAYIINLKQLAPRILVQRALKKSMNELGAPDCSEEHQSS